VIGRGILERMDRQTRTKRHKNRCKTCNVKGIIYMVTVAKHVG